MGMILHGRILKKRTQSRHRTGCRRCGFRREVFSLLVLMLFGVIALTGCGNSSQDASVSQSHNGASSPAGYAEEAAGEAAGGEAGGQSAGQSSGGQSNSDQTSEKKLTLMLYLCGSDLESKTGAATKDLEEIKSSGVNMDLVNVVVMAGGTTQWQNGFSHEETAIYALTGASSADGGLQWEKKESFSSPEYEDAPANMGEQSTLEAFLDFSHENFPADEYALIMWNHGGGPMRGLCWDTAWAKDNLSMKEFTGALKKSPFAKEKLAWIGFDACLMSSIETAHLVTPYADYMIASEETEPCVGWSYDFLAGIEKDSDGKETGQRIVDSFMAAGEAANKASDKEAALTLACMDLSRTGDVEDKLNSFFKTLSKSLSPETFSELSNLREATREFGKAMSDSQRYDLVDLGDLIGNYAEHAPEEAEAFTQALQEMVVYSKSSLEGCSGLSSYHPYYNKTYYEKLWRKEYDSFAFAPYYRDYINNFATIWLGDAMGDWTQMNQVQYAGVEGETQYFSVQLTPEQVQYYASSNLLVLTEPYDGEYSQVFKTNKVTIDENGVLTAGYNGRTLYAVDENGTIVAGPLKYYISDDGHLEIIMMYENFESGAEQLYTHVIYECADAPAGSNLPVLEQYVYDEDLDTWSNRLELREEDYQYMNFSHVLQMPVYNEQTIRPYSEWEESGNVFSYEIPTTEGIHFRFYDHILDDSTLYACFEITDTQANLYGTELMEVNNPNLTAIRFEEGTPSEQSSGPRGASSEPGPGSEDTNPDGASSDNTSGTGQTEGGNSGNTAGTGQSEGGNNDNTAGTGQSEGGEQYKLENDYLRMTVTGYLDNSELSRSLDLKCRIENISDKTLDVDLQNGVRLSDSSRTCVYIPSESTMSLSEFAPGESKDCVIELDEKLLAGISDLQEISFALACGEHGAEEDGSGNDPGAANAGGAAGTGAAEADGDGADSTAAEAAGIDMAADDQSGTDLAGADTSAAEAAGTGNTSSDTAAAGEMPAMGLSLVLHPIEVDLGTVSGYKEYSENPWGLASYTDGTLQWTLRSVQVQRSGDVEFAMICKNQGAEAVVMNPPCEIAVNDVMLRTDTYPFLEPVKTIVLEPGEEFSMVSAAKNIQFYGGNYKNLSGWHHLTISDALGIEGEEEINTVSVYTKYDFLFSFEIPEAKNQRAPVTFFLSNPIPLDRKPADKAMDDSGPASHMDGNQSNPTQEEMTRALDAGGTAPVRTELYSKDGVTVYGEHILIADETILLSLVLDNKSDENAIIQFGGWKIVGPETDAVMHDIGYAYIAFASTTKRIYLELTDYDKLLSGSGNIPVIGSDDSQEAQAEEESIKELTLSFWKIGNETVETEAPSLYQAVFHFADGTAYNAEGGVTVSVEETDPSVTCITDSASDKPFFDTPVAYPEDARQYRKEYSFTLPDSIKEEQRNLVGEVQLAVYRDYYSELTENEKEGLKAQLAASGVQNQTPVCMQFLSYVPMTKSPDQEDTYTCTWSGLVCVPESLPDYYYCVREDSGDSGETVFSYDYQGLLPSLSYWGLKPREASFSSYVYPRFGFSITAGEDSANLTQMMVEDTDTILFSAWPPGLFDSMVFGCSMPAFCRNPGETEGYQALNTGASRGLNGEYSISLNDIPLTLKLMPAQEYAADIKAVYLVFYENGGFEMFDAK